MIQEDPIVYVVDDDPSLRGAIDSLLRSAGWRVQTFVSARDFLDANPHAQHACLILDIRLPGVNGLDLQSELIKRHVDVPVIFLTGHADIPMSVHAMKAGAIEFLTKPFDDEELLGRSGKRSRNITPLASGKAISRRNSRPRHACSED